jgi:hypothetical protein
MISVNWIEILIFLASVGGVVVVGIILLVLASTNPRRR